MFAGQDVSPQGCHAQTWPRREGGGVGRVRYPPIPLLRQVMKTPFEICACTCSRLMNRSTKLTWKEKQNQIITSSHRLGNSFSPPPVLQIHKTRLRAHEPSAVHIIAKVTVFWLILASRGKWDRDASDASTKHTSKSSGRGEKSLAGLAMCENGPSSREGSLRHFSEKWLCKHSEQAI